MGDAFNFSHYRSTSSRIRRGVNCLRNQTDSERRAYATHCIESWGAIWAQGFVQGFTSDPSRLGDLRHSSSASNIAQGRCQ
jgi:hypothetical protein